MRSHAIAVAAFAAGVLAVPFEKRAYYTHTDVEIVYTTDIVTVTAGQANQAMPTPAAQTTTTGEVWGSTQMPWWRPTTTAVSAPQQSPQQSSQQSPQASSTPSPAGNTPTPTNYAEVVVVAHNLHRANHSAADITWSEDLAQIAQEIANTCVYAHSTTPGGGGYGQNIAAGVKGDNISAVITDLFYNGEVNWYDGLYGQAQPSMVNFEHWGHFSQIVWKATTEVGCATADCSGGLANTGGDVLPYFTVCNYKGPGNFANEYGANVGEPLGHPTAQWNTDLDVSILGSLS